MPSNQTDRRDQTERGRAIDRALADDRQGRRRLVDQADEPPPASHGQKSRDLPGVRTQEPL